MLSSKAISANGAAVREAPSISINLKIKAAARTQEGTEEEEAEEASWIQKFAS
jgi:hypothetical protein